MAEENKEIFGEEFEGEQLLPHYVCMKREVLEEEVCETETSSCSEARTTSGNILQRMITDPECRRPPCLGKWPPYPPLSTSDVLENTHQSRAAQRTTQLSQMCSLRVTSDPNLFRQPAIVGTLGPASWGVDSIVELLEAGMNIVRVSMSHANPCSNTEVFQNIIEASNQYRTVMDFNIPIGVMMDLKGPEIRTGKISVPKKSPNTQNEIFLRKGSTVRLTSDKLFENVCTEKMIYIDYNLLYMQVVIGMPIYLSKGHIKLIVDTVENTTVLCHVEYEGYLKNNQRLYIPSLPKILPPLSEYDFKCLETAVKMEVDMIAVPKTRNEKVILDVKEILDDYQEHNNILVLAKLSNFEGLENIDSILRVADGIIIARDDLSLEVSPEKIMVAQKEIIAKCNRMGKPVFCFAQLSVINHHSQRIEMNDIGSVIVDGADGIILVSETALKDQGVQAVTQLSSIIREAEAVTMQKPFHFDLVNEQIPSIEPSKAIAIAAVQISNKIHAAAILAITTTGKTAQMLSWFRPRAPVIAITRIGKTARQLNLWRAVIPLHFTGNPLPEWFQDLRERFEYGISYGKQFKIIKSGDPLVLVSGFRKGAGFTNSIRIVFAATTPEGFVDNVTQYYTPTKDTDRFL